MLGRSDTAGRNRGAVDMFQLGQEDLKLREGNDKVNLRNCGKVRLEPRVQREE